MYEGDTVGLQIEIRNDIKEATEVNFGNRLYGRKSTGVVPPPDATGRTQNTSLGNLGIGAVLIEFGGQVKFIGAGGGNSFPIGHQYAGDAGGSWATDLILQANGMLTLESKHLTEPTVELTYQIWVKYIK